MVRKEADRYPGTQVAGVLQAVFAGRPASVTFRGKTVLTSIFKDPVVGPAKVRLVGIDGDEQADPAVHGGPDQAVYCYPAEHYHVWQDELGRDLGFGAFGENFTVTGLLESTVRLGEVLAIGDTVLQVSKPRLPCFKLGIKFGDQRIVRRFQKSGRSGFYCRVLEEGTVEEGQTIRVLDRDLRRPTIAQLVAATNAAL